MPVIRRRVPRDAGARSRLCFHNEVNPMSDNGQKKFRSYCIADLTYIDIQAYLKEKDTILIPMASMEQHGPHLPLKTDTVTAEEVTRRVC